MVKTRRSSDLSSPIRIDRFKRRALLNHKSREAEGIYGNLSLREAVYKVIRPVFSLSVNVMALNVQHVSCICLLATPPPASNSPCNASSLRSLLNLDTVSWQGCPKCLCAFSPSRNTNFFRQSRCLCQVVPTLLWNSSTSINPLSAGTLNNRAPYAQPAPMSERRSPTMMSKG